MKLCEAAEDFWSHLKYRKEDVKAVLMWTGIYIIGGIIIAFLETKEFLERRARRWKSCRKKNK